MATMILICGKLCSGKTTAAKRLCEERKAVLLSVDELMLAMYDPYLGEKHDEVAARAREYLFSKAFYLIDAGTDVVLDWGFWTRTGREEASARCAAHGVSYQWYGVFPPEEVRQKRIARRNEEIRLGKASGYIVDDGLEAKFRRIFEMPEAAEMEAWITNE